MSKEARWWNQVPEREDAPAVMSDEMILGGHTPQRTIVVVQRADRDHGDGLGVMSHTTALADYVLYVEDTPKDPLHNLWVHLAVRRADADHGQSEEMCRVTGLADYVLYVADAAAGDELCDRLRQIALDEGQQRLREVLDDLAAQMGRRRAADRQRQMIGDQ